MINTPQAEECIKALQDQAHADGRPIMPALFIAADTDNVPTTFLDFTSFSDGMERLKPRVLYLDIRKFDSAEQVKTQFIKNYFQEDDEDEENDDPASEIFKTDPFRALVKRWSDKDGSVYGFTAGFMIDGILHFHPETVEWFTNFSDDVDCIAKEYTEVERERRNSIAIAGKKEVKQKAKFLSEHRQFNAPKTSRAKREYLAEQVFPKVGAYERSQILDQAELMFWYRSTLEPPA